MAEKLGDIMTTQPCQLPASATLLEAACMMRDANIGDVIVTDDDQVVGIVTDRDLVVRGFANGEKAKSMHLGDICSRDIATLPRDASVDDAIRLMQEKAIRRVPVVEDGHAVGVVSIGDLALDRDRESALGSISAAPPNN